MDQLGTIIGQEVTLDSHRRPLWMPASFYPGGEKRQDFSEAEVVVWDVGAKLVKLRLERQPAPLDMLRIFKMYVALLDRQHGDAYSLKAVEAPSCEACGTTESASGPPLHCLCCGMGWHPACADAALSLAKAGTLPGVPPALPELFQRAG